MEYYLHKNLSYGANYWGRIGDPYKVSKTRWMWMRFWGYKATIVPDGTSQTEVLVQAALDQGVSPESFHIERIRRDGHDRGV